MKHPPKKARCKCGRNATRDFLADLPHIQTDPEATDAGLRNRIRQTNDHKRVTDYHYSQSLADVPGTDTVTGPDGERYARFRNKKHRRQVLDSLGMHDAK